MEKLLAHAMTYILIVSFSFAFGAISNSFAADSCPDSETIVEKYLLARKSKGPVILSEGKIDRDRWLALSDFKKNELLYENDVYIDSPFTLSVVVRKLSENPPGSIDEMRKIAEAESARLNPLSYSGDFDQKKWDALSVEEKGGVILGLDPALNSEEIRRVLSRIKSNPPEGVATLRRTIENEVRPRNQDLFRRQGAGTSVSRTKWKAFNGVDSEFVKETEEYLNLFRNVDFSARDAVIVGRSRHVKSMLKTYVKEVDILTGKIREQLANLTSDSAEALLLRQELEIAQEFRAKLIQFESAPDLLTQQKFLETSKYAVSLLGKTEVYNTPLHIRVEHLRRELTALGTSTRTPFTYSSIDLGLQIPTTRALTIEEMNLLSDKGVSFVGVTFRPVSVDGVRLDPEAFLEHDVFHGQNQFLIDPRHQFVEKFFRNSPSDQTKLRHLVWFFFWHERPTGLAITPENFAEFGRLIQAPGSPIMESFLKTLKDPAYFGSEEAIRKIKTADVRRVARDMAKDLSE